MVTTASKAAKDGDLLVGNDGYDDLRGGAGDDTLDGGAGKDYAVYGSDPAGVTVDLANGTATDGYGDTDTLIDVERVSGSQYADQITGDAADNVFRGKGGDDIIDGGDGVDQLRMDRAPEGVEADLSAGTVTVDGYGGSDTISNIENVRGSEFDDIISGDNEVNVLDGRDGDDLLSGGAGDDTLDGGSGQDTADYSGDTAGITVTLANNSVVDGYGDTDTLIDIERIMGSEFNDSLTGSDGDDYLEGGGGNDAIDGGLGDDVLIGGDGADTVDAGDGDDTIKYVGGADIIDGDAGNDEVSFDLVAANNVVLDLSNNTATVGTDQISISDVENVVGTAQADNILGDEMSNRIIGGDGGDAINGAAGNDWLFGSAGADLIDGGAGNDILSGGGYGQLTETAQGSGDWEFVPGGDWSSVVDGDDLLEGGLGDDTFIASFGDDQISVGGNAVQNYQAAHTDWQNAILEENQKHGDHATKITELSDAITAYNSAWQENETAQSNLSLAQSTATSAAGTLTQKTQAKSDAQVAYDNAANAGGSNKILFVSDSGASSAIADVLEGEGYQVTRVLNNFSSGNTPALTGDLSEYGAVYWQASGDEYGNTHTNSTMFSNLESYVHGGGNVFVTGYDSIASPTDPQLINFVGGNSSADTPGAPYGITTAANSLTTGVVDIRGMTPIGGYGDTDEITSLGPNTIGVTGSRSGYQWTLRSHGSGEIAYVSNGVHGTSGSDQSWTNTSSGGAGAYNAVLRNFAASASSVVQVQMYPLQ